MARGIRAILILRSNMKFREGDFMMSYILTEEQQLIVNIARDFAVNEVRPRIPEIDKSEYRPMDLYRRCVELGFRGIMIPEEYGGLGQSLVTQLLVTEQVARVSGNPTLYCRYG